MKILITNFFLENYAGSELYTYDLAKTLTDLGHEVVVFTPHLGEVSKRIQDLSITVVDSLESIKNQKIDIIHAHHNICAILARSAFPRAPMVFLSHGVIPELEHNPSIDLGISHYIAVSEEVRESQIENESVDPGKITIVRNFVDTDRFKSVKYINDQIKNVLVISNYYRGLHRRVIEKACSEMKLNLEVVGGQIKSVWEVEKFINNADLVISLGRGALEAMACNREVIIYDYNGSDGLIRKENYHEVRKNNFSGRRYANHYSVEELVKEMKKYNPVEAKKNRDIILKHHEINSVVEKMIKMYQKYIVDSISTTSALPVSEMNFLLSEQKNLLSSNKELYKYIREIHNSPSWKLASFLHKIKTKILIGRK